LIYDDTIFLMNTKRKPTHCRLWVMLATNAHRGVIVRRGPSSWVQLTLWDTDTDTFTGGQWFRGRIYAERSDLSPDGTKLVYFAAKQGMNLAKNPGHKETWTAISKPPYFTALALWPHGSTWGGGGVFLDNRTVALRGSLDSHPDHMPPKSLRVRNFEQRVEPYRWRMQQNGWQVVSDLAGRVGLGFAYGNEPIIVYQKDSTDHQYHLVMRDDGHNLRQYGDSRVVTYSVHADGKEYLLSDTWADWDHRGRLVYEEQGKLFVADLEGSEMSSTLLADFNPNKPEPVPAPRWAKEWD
jgi:hypothetical protein